MADGAGDREGHRDGKRRCEHKRCPVGLVLHPQNGSPDEAEPLHVCAPSVPEHFRPARPQLDLLHLPALLRQTCVAPRPNPIVELMPRLPQALAPLHSELVRVQVGAVGSRDKVVAVHLKGLIVDVREEGAVREDEARLRVDEATVEHEAEVDVWIRDVVPTRVAIAELLHSEAVPEVRKGPPGVRRVVDAVDVAKEEVEAHDDQNRLEDRLGHARGGRSRRPYHAGRVGALHCLVHQQQLLIEDVRRPQRGAHKLALVQLLREFLPEELHGNGWIVHVVHHSVFVDPFRARICPGVLHKHRLAVLDHFNKVAELLLPTRDRLPHA
mmetsp:Transcript_45817/g.111562  ORF Transcript_45817/g.111562 Transcript_45817/m.111562 type:complete len:326 (-) Transcript_45817:291-1268(-)